MKLQTILIGILATIFLSLSTHVQAQKISKENLQAFNEKADFLLVDVQDKEFLMKGLTLQPQSQSSFKKIAAPVAKKNKIPAATRVSTRPITLKHNGVCYTFSCDKGSGCTDCKMFWFDRNGDRKVQPRRELRCFCSPGKRCKIQVKKSKC